MGVYIGTDRFVNVLQNTPLPRSRRVCGLVVVIRQSFFVIVSHLWGLARFSLDTGWLCRVVYCLFSWDVRTCAIRPTHWTKSLLNQRASPGPLSIGCYSSRAARMADPALWLFGRVLDYSLSCWREIALYTFIHLNGLCLSDFGSMALVIPWGV